MIRATEPEVRLAMAEGLRVMLTKLPAYHPDLPLHRGYDIVLLVRPHDHDRPQIESNLMPDRARELMESACATPSLSGPASSPVEPRVILDPAKPTSSKKSPTRSRTPTAQARSKRRRS